MRNIKICYTNEKLRGDNMNLIYKEITNDNLLLATKIQMQIFPEESAYEHYKWLIELNCEYQKYYLVYDQNEIVGITGIYSNESIEETNSLWLGWYGVLEENDPTSAYEKGYFQHLITFNKFLAKDYLKTHSYHDFVNDLYYSYE